jgi:hypothetical protein
MSFYVTLPNNSSMEYYPNNTCTNYITKLKIPIQLEGHYEVALTEVCLPFNWSAVVDGGFKVRSSKSKKVETIKLNWYIDQSINDIVEYLNKSLKEKSLPLEFSYNMHNYLFGLHLPIDYSIEFLGNTGIELGFDFRFAEATAKMNQFVATYAVPPHVNKLSALYLYTDIIEHQFVGDSFSPLLRTVSIPNSLKYGDYISHNYIQPHYIPVTRNNIDYIKIDLRADTGESIQFVSGKVIVKLHFRPRITY